MKRNDLPLYVHKESKHPPGILENIPLSVNNRLSSISANEEIFNSSVQPYQEALIKSGYSFSLKYSEPKKDKPKKHQRKRKITWFNPPFSLSVKTKVGEKFLKCIDKCFPYV